MATLHIKDIDGRTFALLKASARRSGRSVEEEARHLLTEVLVSGTSRAELLEKMKDANLSESDVLLGLKGIRDARRRT